MNTPHNPKQSPANLKTLRHDHAPCERLWSIKDRMKQIRVETMNATPNEEREH